MWLHADKEHYRWDICFESVVGDVESSSGEFHKT